MAEDMVGQCHWAIVTRAFLPQMLSKGGDKIVVNLGSIAAHLTSPGASAYQTSKLAVLRFTEFLDVDHGPDGVLTFAVHPGGVPTDMGKRLPEQVHKALTETPELCADTLVFLTEKKTGVVSCQVYLSDLGYGGAIAEGRRDCEGGQTEG